MIIRDIIERPTGSPSASRPPRPPQRSTSGQNGFPAARHRSYRSLKNSVISVGDPVDAGNGKGYESTAAGPSRLRHDAAQSAESAARILDEVSSGNLERVQGMDDDEREEERKELEERFGAKIMASLKKRAEERDRVKARTVNEAKDTVGGFAPCS